MLHLLTRYSKCVLNAYICTCRCNTCLANCPMPCGPPLILHTPNPISHTYSQPTFSSVQYRHAPTVGTHQDVSLACCHKLHGHIQVSMQAGAVQGHLVFLTCRFTGVPPSGGFFSDCKMRGRAQGDIGANGASMKHCVQRDLHIGGCLSASL